ncbi:MAG TPA: DNA polymerase I [Candidatus Limnocylindria bacterium]|nr:DNA polymerase I [Candidatus Limnocylindria bacterium]
MQRLMLLDAHSLIYRAYFALIETPLSTSKGQLVNAAFGFWSIVLRGFGDMRPDYAMCCFDVGRSFRADTYSDYKATRRPTPDDLRDQFPIVRETLAAFRIPIHELEGYEADDLIGALTRQAEERGDLETVIVSGDLDMLQLVSQRTSLMTTRMGVASTVIYDPARISERYGLEPTQMIDFKALKGDATDNIPGIPGVGDKTAAKWLQDHGTLEGIYDNLPTIKPDRFRQVLAERREDVFMWRDLVRIDRHAPIALDLTDAELGNYDREEVLRLFRQYEFRTLVERIPAIEGEQERAPGELLRQADRHGPVPAAIVPGRTLRGNGAGRSDGMQLSLDFGGGAAVATATAPPDAATGGPETVVQALPGQDAAGRLAAALRDPGAIESVQRFDETTDEELVRWLAAQPELTVGLALDDPRPRRGTLLGLAVTAPDGRVVTAEGEAAPRLADAILGAGRQLVGHEVKQLLVWELARRDPRAEHSATEATAAELPRATFDTQIAAYILNAALRSQSLSDISAERLGLELPKAGELRGPEHAAVHALAAAAARESLARDLAERPALQRILNELELPLIPVLADMEATGVAVDRAALGQLSEEFSREIGRLEEEIYASVGHQFNLGSPKQLEQVLFYELNLPRGRRTKTGYSTDAGVLEELRPAHPMIPMLLDWRNYTKLRSTYVEALPALLDPHSGRLHTTFQQAVASTGRLSSTDPNLQNIPIRTELGRRIRRAFVAGDPSKTLLAADYSQIELRILAHVSGDVHLREAFERRADVHRETAARVLGKDPSDVSADERSMAKMVNFGLAYGMSDWGLASRANIPREQARDFIDSYFAAYSGIAYYMIHMKDLAKQQGYVETLLGRRRWIPELEARNSALRGAGERMAINMPIQGTAADIMKIAMIRLHEHLRRVSSRARMLLSVHDEVLFEVPRTELELLAPHVREVMEGALALDVPLDVDLKTGDDWESMTPIPRA